MTAIHFPSRPAALPAPRASYLLLVVAVVTIWVVGFEAGPVSRAIGQAGGFLHELFHDGRHLLGAPCH